MPWIPDLALGAIIAALITGAVSLLSLIISKESKTSDFRQAWVDALRAETTELISEYRLYSHRRAAGIPSSGDANSLLKIRASQTSIRLRMKPSEDLTKAAVKVLDEMDDLLARGDWTVLGSEDVARRLEATIQPILKENWERVKSGEPWFQFTRWLVAGVIIIALAVISARAVHPLLQPAMTVDPEGTPPALSTRPAEATGPDLGGSERK